MKLSALSVGRAPTLAAPDGLAIAGGVRDLAPDDERFDPDERAHLVERLEQRIARFEPPVAVLDALRALREPRATAIVTTIEPGFLGGTLGGLVASLQTIRVARSFAHATERPVVPIVWSDADAHAKERVHPARLLNDHADLRRVGLSSVTSRSTVRHADTRFDEATHRLGATRELVRTLCARWPHVDEALATWFPEAGESWSDAVRRALFDALGPLGLVVVEPDDLRVELSRATADLLSPPRGRADLSAVRADQAVAHRLGERGREGLFVAGDELGFVDEPGSRTAAELAASIVAEPEAWCPGAAVLPAAQERVLPVAGRVVAGAALADLAAAAALVGAQGGALAPVVPRAELILVEPEVATALERTGTELARALADGDLVERETPDDSALVRELDALAERTGDALGRIRAELDEADRALDHALRRTSRRIRGELGAVRERARRVHANRCGKSRQHLRRIRQHLRPGGEPQADVLGPLPLYARWGSGIGAALLDRLVAIPAAPVAVFVDAET